MPLLSSVRVDTIILVLLGIASCQQGGIGRSALTGEWLHPLSILGYILGGLVLLVTVAVFAGWKMPFNQSDQQALLAIAVMVGLKIVNALIHYSLTKG